MTDKTDKAKKLVDDPYRNGEKVPAWLKDVPPEQRLAKAVEARRADDKAAR